MNRLTFHENDNASFNIDQDFSMKKSKGYWLNNEFDLEESICKLGQLEDIEEELGIDLITLFKALKNGVWIKIFPKLKNGGSVIHVPCGLAIVEIGGGVGKSFGLEFYVNTKRRYLVLNTHRDNDLKDYGKTWALTREELL